MRNIFLALLLSSLIYTSSSAQEEGFSTIDFSKADKIASLLKVKKLTNLPKLAYNLTHTLNTPVEKFRAIYTWVSLNIDSDYYYQEKVMNARQKLAKGWIW